MNIIVTGAAGFIGSHLCEALLKKGNTVIGIDNFDSFYPRLIKENNLKQIMQIKQGQFVFHEVSILDKAGVSACLQDSKVEMVVHLAAKAGVRPSIEDPMGYYQTNVAGTLNILEMCRSREIQKHIFASSSSVYGNNEKVPFAETDFVDNPISPYAATKKACELMCHTYAHLYGIDTACLRFFTVYGPRQRPDLAIHKFTRLISEGKELPVFGDGTTKRDYTYISDIIDGILKTMAWVLEPGNGTKYEVFNLGESKTVELNYLVSLIEAGLKKKARIIRMPLQPGDVSQTFADISKARKILGYNPSTQIEAGIPKFIEWFRG